METPSPAMRELARRLLEASRTAPTDSGKGYPSRMNDAVVICETLRESLVRFAGPEGFNSLLRRALALARTEVPALANVKINPSGNCQMDGLEEVAAGESATEAAIALAANLLQLLVTFIGEPLTLKLLREAWPDADLTL